MIIGVGVDLVDVARMECILAAARSERFLMRVFSPEEVGVSLNSPRPAEALAARFAAKEALVKALGTGFSRGVAPDQIRVVGGERNKPSIKLSSAALAVAESLNVGRIHVSLSHTRNTASAVVILESDD